MKFQEYQNLIEEYGEWKIIGTYQPNPVKMFLLNNYYKKLLTLNNINYALKYIGWEEYSTDTEMFKRWEPSDKSNVYPWLSKEKVAIFIPQKEQAPDFTSLASQDLSTLDNFIDSDIITILLLAHIVGSNSEDTAARYYALEVVKRIFAKKELSAEKVQQVLKISPQRYNDIKAGKVESFSLYELCDFLRILKWKP